MLMLTGCWDRVEVNDLAIVLATGLDLNKYGTFEGTIQVINTGSISQSIVGGSSTKSFVTISATGRNIDEIVKHQQEKLSRREFYAHRRVLVIGETLARHGIKDIMDHFLRDPETRLRTYVLVTHGESAKKVMEQSYPLERIPAEGLRELEHSKLMASIDIKELAMMLSEEGQDLICNTIMLPNSIDTQTKYGFQLNGSAVFRDGKLVQYLNNKLTRGIFLVRNQIMRSEITFSIPGQNGMLTSKILHSSTKIYPEINGNQVTMHIYVNLEGYISENNTSLDLSNPKYVQLCNTYMSKEIEETIQQSIRETQKNHVDPCGFGDVIHRSHPNTWYTLKTNWRNIIPTIKIDIHVDGQIRRVGMVGPGLQLKQQQVKH